MEFLAAPALVAIIAYAATGHFTSAIICGALLFFAIQIAGALSIVHWLKIDADGLIFGRPLGRHLRLPWGSIAEITPAPAEEVVRRGWLWPPVPPREATRSMSAEGHYRIRSGCRTFYYPPADDASFRAAVLKWAPDPLADRVRTGRTSEDS